MAKEVVIDIPFKENKFKVYLPFIIVITVIGLIFFGIGYATGRYTDADFPFLSSDERVQSITRDGWYVYQNKNFEFEYPDGWVIKTDSNDGTRSISIKGDGGKIILWFDKIQPFKFSSEQLKNQKKKIEKVTKIDSREGRVISYYYKSSDIFSVIKVPSTEEKEKIEAWLNAGNEEFQKILLDIMSTFKTFPSGSTISLLIKK